MRIDFSHLGVAFRSFRVDYWPLVSEFWASGESIFGLWVDFRSLGVDFMPLRVDFGPLEVDFDL